MKKTFSRIMAAAAALMIMLAAAGVMPVQVQAYNQDVSSGVVPIEFVLGPGSLIALDDAGNQTVVGTHNGGSYSGGSGFFVGKTGENPQYIVTNMHVIQEYVQAGEGGVFAFPFQLDSQGRLVYYVAETCELRVD